MFNRLEAFDRNFNFKDPSKMDSEASAYSMQLPDLKLYRDINQSTKVCISYSDSWSHVFIDSREATFCETIE